MPKAKPEPEVVKLNPDPKGEMKDVAGADHDEWNIRQLNLVLYALPGERDNKDSTAIVSGMVDMKPTDPIEGLLIGQLIADNDAAMKLYRLGWINNAEYFNAATKYLQLADKGTRTVLMLTERLDHHRGRGQQQIVVKHVTTVNADQAVITESIVSGETAQLAAGTDRTMQIIESSQKEAMPVGEVQKRNDRQPHAKGSRRPTLRRPIKADRVAVSRASGTWLSRLPNARRSRWRSRGKAKWQLPAWLSDEANDRA
jgi:hypothetical protein